MYSQIQVVFLEVAADLLQACFPPLADHTPVAPFHELLPPLLLLWCDPCFVSPMF